MDLPFDLHYEAPASCPNEGAFRTAVASRLPPATAARRDTRHFRVRIHADADGYGGQLVVQDGDAASTREAHEVSCTELTRSLSLIIAIAADPSLLPAPPAAPPVVLPPPARHLPPPITSVSPRATPRAAPFEWSAGVATSLDLTDEYFVGARVHGQLGYRPARSPVAPALRVSWGFREGSVRVDGDGEARVRYRTARTELCFAPTSARSITPSLCPAFELGTLSARTEGLPVGGGGSTGWYALGAVGRVAVRLGILRFEMQMSSMLPVRRTEFLLVGPERVVYRPPTVSLEAQAGVALAMAFP